MHRLLLYTVLREAQRYESLWMITVDAHAAHCRVASIVIIGTPKQRDHFGQPFCVLLHTIVINSGCSSGAFGCCFWWPPRRITAVFRIIIIAFVILNNVQHEPQRWSLISLPRLKKTTGNVAIITFGIPQCAAWLHNVQHEPQRWSLINIPRNKTTKGNQKKKHVREAELYSVPTFSLTSIYSANVIRSIMFTIR